MLHPSTLKMIERFWEMTSLGRLSWNLSETGSITYNTRGYAVEITPEPHELRFLNADGSHVLERATKEDMQTPSIEYGDSAYDLIRQVYAQGSQLAVQLAPKAPSETTGPSPRYFISYRREDSKQIAGRVYDKLLTRWQSTEIFFDIDSIPLGVDFRAYTREILSSCSHVLVLVGERFVGNDLEQPRIKDQNDFVRTELEMAFSMGISVIPATIDDARMPAPDLLPEEIRDFSFLNAAKLDSGADFHSHMDRIMNALSGPTVGK